MENKTPLWSNDHPQIISNLAQHTISKSYYGLGTTIVLTAFGSAEQRDLDDAYALIARYEDILTVNRDHSELMAVNQAAGQHPVQVSHASYHLAKKPLPSAWKTMALMP